MKITVEFDLDIGEVTADPSSDTGLTAKAHEELVLYLIQQLGADDIDVQREGS